MSFRRGEILRGLLVLLALAVGQSGVSGRGFLAGGGPSQADASAPGDVPGRRTLAGKPPGPGRASIVENGSGEADRRQSPGEAPLARWLWGGSLFGGVRPTTFKQPVPAPLAPPPAEVPPGMAPAPGPVPPPPPDAFAPPPPESVPEEEPLPDELEPPGPAIPIGPVIGAPPPPAFGPTAEPLFGEVVNARECSLGPFSWPLTWLPGGEDPCCLDECGPWRRLFFLGIHEESFQPGIGHDRVMLAPFFIELSQPFNSYRLRIDDVSALPFPDRAEFFWAAPPKGPKPERDVDYQELRLQIQLGGENFSVATDLPVRIVDPVVNDNTAGFSDMTVTQKAVIVDGDYWQITQYFRTYIPTGSARKGLGTGHTSLEPGVLARYKWNDWTYLHSELLYWFPLGSNPTYTGGRLKYALGLSTVLYENDRFAAMPTLEWMGWYFFDGAKTLPDGTIANIDGINLFNIHPGMRFVLGPRDDLGLFSVGLAGGLPLGESRLYDGMLRVELRWSF